MKDEAFDRQWRRRFEEFAATGQTDASIAGWSDTGLHTRLRCFSQRWTGRLRAGLWLDAGCGAGTYSQLLANSGLSVIGADFSHPSIRRAAERYGASASWLVADVTRLPLERKSLDGVVCFGVLQAISDPSAAVRELARCLRGGGELWIDSLNFWCIPNLIRSSFTRLTGRASHLRYHSSAELIRLLEQHGFKEIERFWVPVIPERLARVRPFFEARLVVWLLHLLPPLGALLSHSVMVTGRREQR